MTIQEKINFCANIEKELRAILSTVTKSGEVTKCKISVEAGIHPAIINKFMRAESGVSTASIQKIAKGIKNILK